MRNDCEIVKDLLPNYIENLVSKDTKEYVEEHIKNCNKCKKVLETMTENNIKMEKNDEEEEKIELDHLKKYRRKMLVIKLLVAICAIVIIIGGVIGVVYVRRYKQYAFISNKLKESTEAMKQLDNYKLQFINRTGTYSTGKANRWDSREYYYKDNKYKLVNKELWEDYDISNIKTLTDLSNSTQKWKENRYDYTRYGEYNTNMTTEITPSKQTIKTSISDEPKNHYIDHILIGQAVREWISADDKDWVAGFAIDSKNNSIREEEFYGIDCYVVTEKSERGYEERWFDKTNGIPVRRYSVIYEYDSFSETIVLYSEGNVTDEDVNFNEAEYEGYTFVNV